MSAQGGTITGRKPVHVPIRPIVAVIAAASAAAIMFGVMQGQAGRTEAPVAEVHWGATTGHPALHDRFGVREDDERATPVQRLYPGGFGS